MDVMELFAIIKRGEGRNTEFKADFPKQAHDIAKEIVALANAGGGYLLMGVEDDGTPKGIPDPARAIERLAGIARSCDPPLSPDIDRVPLGEDAVIVYVKVPAVAPCLYQGKVFVRVGSTCREATHDDLKSLLKDPGHLLPQPKAIERVHTQLPEALETLCNRRPFLAGRDVRFGLIDEFVQQKESGYLLLHGEAGIGKSAVLAHWCQQRKDDFLITAYFFSRDFQSTSVLTGLAAINRDLKRFFGTTDVQFDPLDMVAVKRALWDLLRRHHSGKVVAVLDGLDEATSEAPTLSGEPFPRGLLPPDPAPGTYIILAGRSGFLGGTGSLQSYLESLGLREDQVQVAPLAPMNQVEDIQNLIKNDPSLVRIRSLAEDKEFCRQLLERTSGNPLFLTMFLEDLAHQNISDDTERLLDLIQAIPTNLTHYVRRHFELVWRQTPGAFDWSKLFGVLSIVNGPVPLGDLGQLLKTETRNLVPEALPWEVKRWLRWTLLDAAECWAFNHAFVGEAYLEAGLPTQPERTKLKESLADYCCRNWGISDFAAQHAVNLMLELDKKNEINELSQSDEFLRRQQRYPAAGDALLQKSLEFAIAEDDLPSIVARAVRRAIWREDTYLLSPLRMLEEGTLERAWELAELHGSRGDHGDAKRLSLWHLLVIYKLLLSDRREDAYSTARRCQSVLAGGLAQGVLLSHIFELDHDIGDLIAEALSGSEATISVLALHLCQSGRMDQAHDLLDEKLWWLWDDQQEGVHYPAEGDGWWAAPMILLPAALERNDKSIEELNTLFAQYAFDMRVSAEGRYSQQVLRCIERAWEDWEKTENHRPDAPIVAGRLLFLILDLLGRDHDAKEFARAILLRNRVLPQSEGEKCPPTNEMPRPIRIYFAELLRRIEGIDTANKLEKYDLWEEEPSPEVVKIKEDIDLFLNSVDPEAPLEDHLKAAEDAIDAALQASETLGSSDVRAVLVQCLFNRKWYDEARSQALLLDGEEKSFLMMQITERLAFRCHPKALKLAEGLNSDEQWKVTQVLSIAAYVLGKKDIAQDAAKRMETLVTSMEDKSQRYLDLAVAWHRAGDAQKMLNYTEASLLSERDLKANEFCGLAEDMTQMAVMSGGIGSEGVARLLRTVVTCLCPPHSEHLKLLDVGWNDAVQLLDQGGLLKALTLPESVLSVSCVKRIAETVVDAGQAEEALRLASNLDEKRALYVDEYFGEFVGLGDELFPFGQVSRMDVFFGLVLHTLISSFPDVAFKLVQGQQLPLDREIFNSVATRLALHYARQGNVEKAKAITDSLIPFAGDILTEVQEIQANVAAVTLAGLGNFDESLRALGIDLSGGAPGEALPVERFGSVVIIAQLMLKRGRRDQASKIFTRLIVSVLKAEYPWQVQYCWPHIYGLLAGLLETGQPKLAAQVIEWLVEKEEYRGDEFELRHLPSSLVVQWLRLFSALGSLQWQWQGRYLSNWDAFVTWALLVGQFDLVRDLVHEANANTLKEIAVSMEESKTKNSKYLLVPASRRMDNLMEVLPPVIWSFCPDKDTLSLVLLSLFKSLKVWGAGGLDKVVSRLESEGS